MNFPFNFVTLFTYEVRNEVVLIAKKFVYSFAEHKLITSHIIMYNNTTKNNYSLMYNDISDTLEKWKFSTETSIFQGVSPNYITNTVFKDLSIKTQ